MALSRIIPRAADYDIWSYACSQCPGIFSMVESRTADRSAVDERRGVRRYVVTTPAKIEFRSSAIACMVRNVSATGACLSLSTPALLQKLTFTLRADGSPRLCRAVWRKGKQVGIAFE
jgi:hypothetical protein